MDFLRQILNDEMSEEDEHHGELNLLPSRPRRILTRADPFNFYDDVDFKLRFRLDKESAQIVLSLISSELEHPSQRYVPTYLPSNLKVPF